MKEWGIKHFQPAWTDSAAELSALLKLASLEQQKIESIWLLRDEENEWFEDAPIVICTETTQLEFCANQLDYFSFSTNSIDLSAAVYWCTTEYSGEKPMYWTQGCDAKIQALLGKQVGYLAKTKLPRLPKPDTF